MPARVLDVETPGPVTSVHAATGVLGSRRLRPDALGGLA
jgi:hypothetical protein